MALITAQLSNYRQSPRKVRLVADMIRGKNVDEALVKLQFLTKRASDPIHKLMSSAISNAKNNMNLRGEDMVVKEIRVDMGPVMKRSMPKAFGRSGMIRKKMSHVKIVLEAPDEVVAKAAKKPRAKKVTTTEAKAE